MNKVINVYVRNVEMVSLMMQEHFHSQCGHTVYKSPLINPTIPHPLKFDDHSHTPTQSVGSQQ